jgi:hypothetical protein
MCGYFLKTNVALNVCIKTVKIATIFADFQRKYFRKLNFDPRYFRPFVAVVSVALVVVVVAASSSTGRSSDQGPGSDTITRKALSEQASHPPITDPNVLC